MSLNSPTQSAVIALLSQLKADLQHRYGITRIGIFGSVSREESNAASDIDIVVHMRPDLLQRIRLKTELESAFGRPVDVVRYRDSMNPYLKARIDREAVYV